jgi:hypothetical protein
MEWTPQTASVCQSGGVDWPLEEASVNQVGTIGLDIAKNVFQTHGADAIGRVMFRKRLTRDAGAAARVLRRPVTSHRILKAARQSSRPCREWAARR